ncbi:MAG: 1,6-dihydroxycyclohexa-2,4-diene-1-carboxylate dehydrogenase [Gammaproteobacteria bacterium]|nr:MAG: 1,6-dihydroxycyclohexa-2,4-diene-1-carboxylate dehydrogenase [Gammaproteobacteria bacterium]
MSNTSCKRFIGQAVIITGAAQGIGFACARRLGGEGAKVLIVDRAEQAAIEAAQNLRSEGIDAEYAAVDLTTYVGAIEAMEICKQKLGGIDVLVNNVGGTIWKKPFWHYSEEEIRQEVDRSFWPTMWCCRAVLPYLQERGSGAIVNVGSNAAQGIYRIPYCSSKGGVAGLTTALALELADFDIRVNCVCPGATEVADRKTDRAPHALTMEEETWAAEFYTYIKKEGLFSRFATVDEQAAVIAFIASDDASYITGEIIYTGIRGTRISEIGQIREC